MAVEKFSRNISANGTRTIDGVEVKFNFNVVNSVAPTSVEFNFTTEDGAWVAGSVTKEGLSNYSVTNGIVENEIMEDIKIEGKVILENYATV
jgi:hypothetical protein